MSQALHILTAFTAGLAGCTHTFMKGNVVMKVNDQEGYVWLNENEAKVGDKVALFKSDCSTSGTSRITSADAICRRVRIGDGEITQLINDHYSVIKTNPNVSVQEGMIVEKY
jgi:hypothetical protein